MSSPSQTPDPCAVRERLRRRALKRRRRGVALFMVLGALTILTVMLTEFQDGTSAEFGSALSARDALKAEYAAHSAVNLSRLIIATEPTIRKTLAPLFLMMKSPPPQIPVWEFADMVLGAFNDSGGAEKFKTLAGVPVDEGRNLGLEDAGFDVKVIDEDSKININLGARDLLTQNRLKALMVGLLSPAQYDPLFNERDADGNHSDRQAICGAMIDWVDANQDLSDCDPTVAAPPSPAPEDSYYQLLKDPYERKNAPFDSLEELRLVRGVGDDFWATFVEPNPQDPTERNLTVWGQGKVNVNTANAQTIWAALCGGADRQKPPKICTDPAEALKFISTVNLVKQFTSGAPIFSSPKGFIRTLAGKRGMLAPLLTAIGLEPIVWASEAEAEKALTTESKVFSVYATGYVKSGKRETRVLVHAVVDFRGAPGIPDAMLGMMQSMVQGGQLDPNQLPKGAQDASLPENASDDAIRAALAPDPAGRVIYYRVD